MAVDPTGTVDEVVRTAVECGFDIEGWGSEFDTSAYEVNIRYRDALEAADDAFVFRLLSHELPARRGLLATYMGRPLNDRGGTGLHLNFSFRRAEDGTNALHDPDMSDGLSKLARQCIAGMLAHHEGLSAICAPTVNAYKRLQPDMLNGYWANWGYDDRSVGVRVAPDRGATTRLENRVPDGAANPYLMPAAILHAARFGMEQGLEPPPAQPVGAAPNTDVHIPATLEDALAGVPGRQGALRRAGRGPGDGVRDAEGSGVEALHGGRVRPDDHRRHRLGDRVLPPVLLAGRRRSANERGAGASGAGPSSVPVVLRDGPYGPCWTQAVFLLSHSCCTT